MCYMHIDAGKSRSILDEYTHSRQDSFAKETCNSKEPTNRSHPILLYAYRCIHTLKTRRTCSWMPHMPGTQNQTTTALHRCVCMRVQACVACQKVFCILLHNILSKFSSRVSEGHFFQGGRKSHVFCCIISCANSLLGCKKVLCFSRVSESRMYSTAQGRVCPSIEFEFISTIMRQDFSVPIKPISRLVLKANSSSQIGALSLQIKVGLGISRTNADSQWNPVYNAFHRNFLLWKRNDSSVL